MITLIDYKAGNLTSVRKAFTHLGQESVITDDPEVVRNAKVLVLPGVGHFCTTERLAASGVRDAVLDAISRGTPFLGICVGMQWQYAGSTEAPETKGLGLFEGSCERFQTKLKVPHVGWNQIQRTVEGQNSRLLEGVPDESFVYFTHSYRAPVVAGVCAVTVYDEIFASCVERDNVFGVQFHPEKSGDTGLRILKNFCNYAAERSAR
ncbi:MAG: imidazole glycerol phosphate synthase subunit HisH [Acidobacteria bacterium]|nr:MAG: imidazole glycerol phosphate synthase subunit HisH [Acidobacteriota bacterium]